MKNQETIKSVTTCPTCGSEVDVKADGETHYYIPKNKTISGEEMSRVIKGLTQIKDGDAIGGYFYIIANGLLEYINENK